MSSQNAIIKSVYYTTCETAFANENRTAVVDEKVEAEQQELIQCQKFVSHCGTSKITGTVKEDDEIPDLKDGILSMLNEESRVLKKTL